MARKKINLSRFSGFERIKIAPTCATASVKIVGGSAGRSPGVRDKYRSLSEMFLMPTMRLSGSNSVTRSTNRNGYRCGKMRPIAA